MDKEHQKLNRSGNTGHRQMKNRQYASISLRPGGAMVWSVCIQTKPVVMAALKSTINPTISTGRF